MNLTSRIILAMVLAMAGGIFLKFINDSGYLSDLGQLILLDFFTEGILDVVGQIFIASLRLVIVPLVFFSLVCGVVSISSSSRLGTISLKTLSLYLLTTAIAISVALTFALIFKPGVGIDLALPTAFEAAEAPSLKQVLIDIFPTNPIAAMAEGNMLQIIVFSILFGIALKSLGEAGSSLKNSFEVINNVILSLVRMLIELAPYGPSTTKIFLLASYSEEKKRKDADILVEEMLEDSDKNLNFLGTISKVFLLSEEGKQEEAKQIIEAFMNRTEFSPTDILDNFFRFPFDKIHSVFFDLRYLPPIQEALGMNAEQLESYLYNK